MIMGSSPRSRKNAAVWLTALERGLVVLRRVTCLHLRMMSNGDGVGDEW